MGGIPSSFQGDDIPEFNSEEDAVEIGALQRDFLTGETQIPEPTTNDQNQPIMDRDIILEVIDEEEDGTIMR